jgi:hypothetical protein
MDVEDYAINVRAKVRATQVDPDADGDIPDWEIYDSDDLGDGAVLISCDRLVRVQAGDKAKAIELAKDAVGPIVLKGYEIEDVTLWVDEGIDVNPEFAESSGPTP